MPFKYGIEVETEKVLSRNYYNDDVTYVTEIHLTPKDFADTHSKGVKMLVSVTGKPLTGWFRINPLVHDLTALKRNSKSPAVGDFIGNELSIGDYVSFHYRKMDDLQIGEIIGFVKQGKARIIPVGNYEQSHGVLRFPDEMIQIPAAVLGEDPTGEWIPTEEEMF
jgi:hypothetical protein